MDIEGSEEWFGTEKETIDKREEQRLERAFPEGGGAVMAIVPEEVRKEDVTKAIRNSGQKLFHENAGKTYR